MSATGRPERELLPLGGSAAAKPQAWGRFMSATGRPEREYRSAQREGTPMNSAALCAWSTPSIGISDWRSRSAAASTR